MLVKKNIDLGNFGTIFLLEWSCPKKYKLTMTEDFLSTAKLKNELLAQAKKIDIRQNEVVR